jgi:hypothetical protein
MFVIDVEGDVHIIGTYPEPEIGFTDVIERRKTLGNFRYIGMECGGVARRLDDNDEPTDDCQRVYVVAVVDRNLDIGIYSLFESTPEDPLIEDNPEGQMSESLKSTMACVVLLEMMGE